MKSGHATLVATLTAPVSDTELRSMARAADWIEVRADLAGDLDVHGLRAAVAGESVRFLYTLRSLEQGGRSKAGDEERLSRLAAASGGYDAVDLEAERDVNPDVLEVVSPERRLVSWHGPAQGPRALDERLAAMRRASAILYKLVPSSGSPGQDLAGLEWLTTTRGGDVALFAGGPAGTWTRLLAPRIGAPWMYLAGGGEAGAPAAPGQPSLDRWRRDYDVPVLGPVERLFGIVGNPTTHSLSPRLHNAGYRAHGLPFLYVAFEPAGFGDFWLEIAEDDGLERLGAPLFGLSVTAPFKEAALAVAGATSPIAERIGAVNTLVWEDGTWVGDTTDPEGVSEALHAAGVSCPGQRAAVLGCGAAGRAAAVGLQLAGAAVTLFNRSSARGGRAAASLALPVGGWRDFDPSAYDIVVHATPLGRETTDPLPFDAERVTAGAAVVDLVYGESPTSLARAVRRRGATLVDGRMVLWHQARGQYRRMTGRTLPAGLAAECLAETDGESPR